MAVNKVEINGEVKLDLTQDTVTEDTLLKGASAHDAAGNPVEGKVVTTPVPKTSNLLKGDGMGGVTAAAPGTDYEAAAFAIVFTLQRYGLGHYRIVSSKTGEQIVAAFKAGLWVTASLEGVQLDVSAANSSGGYDFVSINADGTIAGVRLEITDVTDIDTGEIIKNYSFVQIQYQCMQGPSGSSIAQNALWGTDENGVWTTVYSITLGNLPAVSTADNGKFLRVVNGAWVIAAIDNANGGSF